MSETMCACGRPLHYSDPALQKITEDLVQKSGERIKIHYGSRTWLVPRHFIALHGLKAKDLPTLGFEEVTHV